jgi:hypothetical protein
MKAIFKVLIFVPIGIFLFGYLYLFGGDLIINFNESEKQGNLIIDAIKKYHEDIHEYPQNLDVLVPEYLSEIPEVQMRTGFKWINKDFIYYLVDYIPHEGCFYIDFQYKPDGKTYRYNSISDSIVWTLIGTINTDYIEELITYDDIWFLVHGVKSYFADSLQYPEKLTSLIPTYIDSLPYDTNSKYRTEKYCCAELVTYEFHQPADTFRGNFHLYFDVSMGQYRYGGNGHWYYDD